MPVARGPELIPNFDLIDPDAPDGGGFPGHTVITSTGNGDWNAAGTWDLARTPITDDIVHILEPHTVTLDSVETAIIFSIGNYGTFRVNPAVNTQLIVQHVMNYGTLELGTAGGRVANGVTCVIEVPDIAIDEDLNPIHHGHGIHNFGTWHSFGFARIPIGKLSADIIGGNGFFLLVENPQTDLGWQVGDKLNFPDTRRLNFLDAWNVNWEYKTITGFAGNHQVNVDTPFEGDHTNMRFSDNPGVIVRNTEVINLTQNIILRSANQNGVRGQTICHDNSLWRMNNVLFLGMGRTINHFESLGSPGPEGNRQGRYSWHVHHCLCPGLGDFADATMDSCVFWANSTLSEAHGASYDSSMHDPRRWGVAYHNTSFWKHSRCVHHGWSGSGLTFAEQGNETRALVSNCVSSRIGGTGARDEIASGNVFGQQQRGFTGSGYFGQSVQVRLEDISAYDCPAGGYTSALYLQNFGTNIVPVPIGPGDDYLISGGESWNMKERLVAGINGLFGCGPMAFLSQKWYIGLVSGDAAGSQSGQEQVYNNFFAYNTLNTAGEYEQFWVTINGLYMVNAGKYAWYDYIQVDSKIINAKLENSSIHSPAACHLTWTLENIDLAAGSYIRFFAYNDINNGFKMFRDGVLQNIDMYLINVTIHDGVENPIQCQGESRLTYINQAVPGTADPVADTLAAGASSETASSANVWAGQRIHIVNHRGAIGANGRLYHNMQAAGAMAPYSLFLPNDALAPIETNMELDGNDGYYVVFTPENSWGTGQVVKVLTAGGGLETLPTTYVLGVQPTGTGFDIVWFYNSISDALTDRSSGGAHPELRIPLTAEITSQIQLEAWSQKGTGLLTGNIDLNIDTLLPPTYPNLTVQQLWDLLGWAPFREIMAPEAVPHADFFGGSVVLAGGTPNTPPTISDIANQQTPMNTPTAAIPFTVDDAETPAAALTVTGLSSNPTLVPNNPANIAFGGSGANRTVTLTPATGQTGTTTITVRVFDGGGMSEPDTFVLTVAAPAGAPTISDIANQVILRDTTTGALAFTVGDVETPAAALEVTATSSNTTLVPNGEPNIVLGGSGENRTITITPAFFQTGMTTITVIVEDEDDMTAMDTFTVTVNPPAGTLGPLLAHMNRMRRR